ncbi:cysteine hydrolase family protein [Pseudonocardia parietis]|uniref:Nicotinamidase-related amidase n=1 Tax=Pseudonocardia parietis TaxID=570936 RepID=A0ABS4VXK0_9PSEU|nr:cysteine hydrolase family protein [Pseudonocardia parietis]MBP2368531.1 nicotinamidase-related amidase [Pseudonocardia parietis]
MSSPRRALIVIDVQQEYFEGPLAIHYPPRDESLARIVDAIDTAASQGVPIVVVRHEYPEGAPVFAAGSEGARLHPEVESRRGADWKQVTKNVASVFAGNDLTDWLRQNDVDTVTLVGYMTNNCILGSAAAAEPLGFTVEVLRDASGAIHLSNEAGTVSAQQLHEALMTLLHSNYAATTTTDAWRTALGAGDPVSKGDLGTSAVQGLAAHS